MKPTNMFKIFFILFLCQHFNVTYSTRLPLEVFHWTTATAAAAAQQYVGGADALSAAVGATAMPIKTTTKKVSENFNYIKQQHFEYATINAKQKQEDSNKLTARSHVATTLQQNTLEANRTITKTNNESEIQQLDRRRSRKILDSIKQLKQIFLHGKDANSQNNNNIKNQFHTKDVRILYQVGESENDLPICTLNAVCSKIDLYETPWIERQCRCPLENLAPNIVIHHHQHSGNGAANDNLHLFQQHKSNMANRFRSYYEQEKLLQRQHVLVGDIPDKKLESLHLKKLMQKLGAVYQDDFHLPLNEYLEKEVNAAFPLLKEYDEINDNEFPHEQKRAAINVRGSDSDNGFGNSDINSAHMRHSGYTNHKIKDFNTFIGGCPSSLGIEDGYTIADKTRHYKLCQPVHKLPVCKHFRDYTWTLKTFSEMNITEQIVHCRCPKNSVTYLTKREPATDSSSGYTYLFACSPLTRLRCQRKQPCKLFTVRKRQEFLDEVNINSLCQCPKGHICPSHHTQSGVIPGESFLEDNIQTYSGYCMIND